MPFFKVNLNNNNEVILGDESLELLEVSLLSVGPKYDVDLLSHGIMQGTSKSISFLNEKFFTGDVLKVSYLEYSQNSTDKFISLNREKKIEESCDVRKFKIKQENDVSILISAAGTSSLSANFIWHKKSGICNLSLGNTGYNNDEQWMKLNLVDKHEYTIVIESSEPINRIL